MFCSRCGAKADDQAKFCPSCGNDFSTIVRAPGAEPAEVAEIDSVRAALREEWEIESELGRGGMAIVYRARDKQLGREVAIKVLPFSLAFDKQFVERFQREARTSAQLEHPHIIPIYRVGRADKVIFFVMKFLRGGSLSTRLERRGALEPGEIRRLLIETAGALGYAHRHGIVHRDIKPDNIMFDEIGHSVLTDFGIAKAATGTKLTGTGMSIGTPHYMSPEQAKAQPLDGRSDIYSLGVVAYQCLAGQVPFDGEDAFSIGYKHIMEPVPEPPLERPEARELFEIIKKMMAKAPEDRFQTADELAAVLQGGLASGEQTIRASLAEIPAVRASIAEQPTAVIRPSEVATPPQARPSMPTGPMVRASTPTTPIPRTQPTRAAPRKKRGGVLVGLFVVLVLGLGGAGGYWYFVLGGKWPGAAQPAGAGAPTEQGPIVLLGETAKPLAEVDSTPSRTDTAPRPVAELPPTGRLVVTGVPRGAQWSLDGAVIPAGDTVRELEPGTYRIRATRLGYDPFDTSLAVARGDTAVVPVVLRPVRRAAQPRPTTTQDTRVSTEPKPGAEQKTVPTVTHAVDSAGAPKAAPADYCSEPGPDYNKDGSCFDTRPEALTPPLVPVAERLEDAQLTVWVQVLANGQVGAVRPVNRAAAATRFGVRAIPFARQSMTYKAATKSGAPVDAWLRITLRAR